VSDSATSDAPRDELGRLQSLLSDRISDLRQNVQFTRARLDTLRRDWTTDVPLPPSENICTCPFYQTSCPSFSLFEFLLMCFRTQTQVRSALNETLSIISKCIYLILSGCDIQIKLMSFPIQFLFCSQSSSTRRFVFNHAHRILTYFSATGGESATDAWAKSEPEPRRLDRDPVGRLGFQRGGCDAL